MAKRARGKNHRKGLTLTALMDMFPNDETAREWFEQQFWPEGPRCPYCGSENVQAGIKHKTMTHRCRQCANRPMFSLKTGTVMEGSNLKYRVWAIAVYLLTTSLKSVSSMKLHRDLGITQKSAWHLAHRIRKSWSKGDRKMFLGPAEADETYVGGKRRNMPKAIRKELDGRGPVGKTAVLGIKDRATNKVSAVVIENTDSATLQGFVRDQVQEGAKVYTDDALAYDGLVDYDHESVKHSVAEYVRGNVHTNGIESFWSMLKRAHKGTFHKISPKHLDRYVQEFAGRHNIRELDTATQMGEIARKLAHKRLRYWQLIANNGLPSGARV